ncbi:hypothetical protein HPP92_016690 [Vanilla planifolia]|uniref:Uncharacterized protein n=1 Tax=Vanilla planifolia TaxID=51239 RepID=A0A835URI1_VANPL|nr:hypothetical protein HPP92_016690 [Vanilla planifolia]
MLLQEAAAIILANIYITLLMSIVCMQAFSAANKTFGKCIVGGGRGSCRVHSLGWRISLGSSDRLSSAHMNTQSDHIPHICCMLLQEAAAIILANIYITLLMSIVCMQAFSAANKTFGKCIVGGGRGSCRVHSLGWRISLGSSDRLSSAHMFSSPGSTSLLRGAPSPLHQNLLIFFCRTWHMHIK